MTALNVFLLQNKRFIKRTQDNPGGVVAVEVSATTGQLLHECRSCS